MSIFWAAGAVCIFGAGRNHDGGDAEAASSAQLATRDALVQGSSSGALAAEAEQGLDCGPVSACTDKCGAACPSGIRKLGCLLSCKSDCRAKGCTSARTVFDELTDCIASSCWTSCMSGPTPECRACTEEECSPEAKRCHEHKCAK